MVPFLCVFDSKSVRFLFFSSVFVSIASMDYSPNYHNSTASLAVNIMNLTVNERLMSDKSTDILSDISSQDDITSMKARMVDFDTNNNGLYIRLGYGDCKYFGLNVRFQWKIQNLFLFLFVFFGNTVSDLTTQMMITLISTGAMLWFIVGYLFVRQIPSILQNTPSKYQSRTIILCGIYSVTGSAALVSLIVYRSAVLCDSISHFAFVMGAYQYFTLVIDYYGGESEFIKHTNGLKVFNIQTPPCCCCLQFLLPSEITKYIFLLHTLLKKSSIQNNFTHLFQE